MKRRRQCPSARWLCPVVMTTTHWTWRHRSTAKSREVTELPAPRRTGPSQSRLQRDTKDQPRIEHKQKATETGSQRTWWPPQFHLLLGVCRRQLQVARKLVRVTRRRDVIEVVFAGVTGSAVDGCARVRVEVGSHWEGNVLIALHVHDLALRLSRHHLLRNRRIHCNCQFTS